MLEKMGEFFDSRLDGYDEHMMTNIEGAVEFYPFTAAQLPKADGARVVDLGAGTGLELMEYFKINPHASVVAIDLAPGMLGALREKLAGKDVTLIQGSYFDMPLGTECFDAAVSVESLHHFTQNEKILLYKKLHGCLLEGSFFILTDYFARSDEEEKAFRYELLRLKVEQGISDDEFYHFDTPLTVEHEIEALRAAGFSHVETLASWGATYTIKAVK